MGTKGKWIYKYSGHRGCKFKLMSHDGKITVLTCHEFDVPPEEIAKLICKSLNNHDRLVKALEDMLSLFDRGFEIDTLGRDVCDRVRQILKEIEK